jgi:hypothetical protein
MYLFCIFLFLFLVGWDFWYCGHYWPFVPAPDDSGDCREIGGMKIGRESKVFGENLPQHHFVHHKFHMTRPRFEPATVRSQ